MDRHQFNEEVAQLIESKPKTPPLRTWKGWSIVPNKWAMWVDIKSGKKVILVDPDGGFPLPHGPLHAMPKKMRDAAHALEVEPESEEY